MRIQQTFLALTLLACTLSFAACKVETKDEGEAPKVEVDPGKPPEVEVKGPDIDVKKDTTVVETPDVEVKPPR
jgi:hypothetical protein